jgi:hypothetical protein
VIAALSRDFEPQIIIDDAPHVPKIFVEWPHPFREVEVAILRDQLQCKLFAVHMDRAMSLAYFGLTSANRYLVQTKESAIHSDMLCKVVSSHSTSYEANTGNQRRNSVDLLPLALLTRSFDPALST